MKKKYLKVKLGAFVLCLFCVQSCVFSATVPLWQIGTADQDYAELAIAGDYAAYPGTFPSDVDYTVEVDSPGTDWSYIQPSTSDGWAGTRQHPFLIRFDHDIEQSYVLYQLDIHLVASQSSVPPLITLDINGQTWQYQTTVGFGDGVLTDPAGGNFQTYTTYVDPGLLQATGNLITITTTGSWMLYDAIAFQGIDSFPPLVDFDIVPQPYWYNHADGVSRLFRLDFMGSVLRESAQVEIVTPLGTFSRDVNTEGNPVGYVDILAPMPSSNSQDPNTVTITLHTSQSDPVKTASVPPERQWEVYLVHQTHLDIGYTHTQPEVMELQVDNIYNALDYIDQSDANPDDERFKFHPEGMWAVEEFLNNRASQADKNRFIQATRDGRMHMDALYAQAMTGIYSEEQLFELMGAAKRYEQEYGIDITSAMQTDVPGYTWGLTSALGHWGVKTISAGPNYGGRVGHTFEWGDQPFYWVSPSGKQKVLFWMAGRGYSFFFGSGCVADEETKIMGYLDELDMEGYPYDMVNIRYAIGGDNGPPNSALPGCVQQWNDKYAYPKLIIARNSQMMADFEQRYGDQIPVRQKDFTPYWEDGCASTAADTAVNRRACEKIVQAQTLWSMLNAGDFPHEDFDQAWQKMIMYDEHTWGAWNSISDPDSAFAVQQAAYKKQFALDGASMTDALMDQAIAGIQQAATNTIDVFNTLNWPRTELVLVSAADSSAGDVVKDDTDTVVPSQRLSTGELAFVASSVPALEVRRYTIHAGSSSATGSATVSGNTISNSIIAAQLDTQNGAITSLTRSGITGNLVDTSIGEGVNDYLYILGRDASVGHQRITGPVTVTILDNGPLVAAVKLRTDAPGCNYLERVIRVVDGLDQLFLYNTVDKLKERNPESVTFGFPFNVPDGVMKIDLQWGVMQPEIDQIEGANKNFFCTRRWIDISNTTHGVTWSSLDAPMVQFNPIKFAANLYDNNAFRMFLDPGQAFHSWVMNNHWETNYKADQEGVMTFRYALQPHIGSYDPVASERFGRSLHQPLLAVSANPASPVASSLLDVQGDGIVVSTVEPSRDGSALMVRLYNSDADTTVSVTVNWPGGGTGSSVWLSSPFEDKKSEITGPFSMDPFEIVTLRLQKYVSDPQILISGATLDFGQVDNSNDLFEDVTITNLGASNTLTTTASIVSGDTTRFSVAAQAGPIAPGGDSGVYVRFSPDGFIGSTSAVMEIASNDPDDSVKTVSLIADAQPSDIYEQLFSPSILNYSSQSGGYPASQAIDFTANEWASNGDGANTYIEFDFGSAATVDAILLQDRSTSDRIESFSLTFSDNTNFGGPGDVTLNFTNSSASSAALYEFAAQAARYVRLDVVTVSGGSNQGIAEIAFYKSRPIESQAIPSSKITASASSIYAASQDTADVVNGSGLTGDQHDNNATSDTMWHGIVGPPFGGVSNPHSGTEAGAEWIKFEFDKIYRLNEMVLWNHNQQNLTDRSMNEVYIEYSTDGTTYTNLAGSGNTINLKRAPGMNGVLPTDVIDFGGVQAKYVVITCTTANPNFGGNVVGMSESRFTFNNYPPSFNSNPVIEVGALETRLYGSTLADDASDPDTGDSLSFIKLSGAPWLNISEDGTLSGTPAQKDVGENHLAVQVSDGTLMDLVALQIFVQNLYDGKLGMNDFVGFANQWLEADCGFCGGADLDEDHDVDFQDILVFVESWLSTIEI